MRGWQLLSNRSDRWVRAAWRRQFLHVALATLTLTGCREKVSASHADAAVTDGALPVLAVPDASSATAADASLEPDAPPAGKTAPEADRPPDIVVPTLETE
jgi:hypothetical protein